MNTLEQLRQHTKVVADTGDIESISLFKPTDATTNPSLIYASATDPKYKQLVDEAISYAKLQTNDRGLQLRKAMEKVSVNFGLAILNLIPGRISTEVDARLSFDKEATIASARNIISLYEENNIDRNRILIKIAATWEGIKAAEKLEKEAINCNLTLVFSKTQAIACAEAGVYLISPFVGRILDWHKKALGINEIPADQDPGVKSVKEIFNYFKQHNHKTIVMGASFRSVDEILQLSGCDALTIGPDFLKQLESENKTIDIKLNSRNINKKNSQPEKINENTFRWELNENVMASEKLAEGIRNFTKDLIKLEEFIKKQI